jgi:hypothetical protein
MDCVCVCVCAVLLNTLPFNSAVQHTLYNSNGTSCPVLCPRPDHQSAVHSMYIIKTYQCQYSFCQTLQGADRAGTCRRTSSCHDSQTGNHANSRHCWIDMHPVNLYTIHEPCEQCRLLKMSLCSAYTKATKLLCLSHNSEEAWYLPFPHHHFNTKTLTFYDCCQQNWKRSHSWRVGFLYSPTIIQITLTLVRLSLSWSEVNCFVLYGMRPNLT